MKLTRRRLLKWGLGGTALLALGGVGLSLRSTLLRTPRRPLQALDAKEFSVLTAVADRLLPDNPPFPSAWALEIPEKADAYLATIDPADLADLKAALGLLESAAAGLLLDGRTKPFTRCSPEEQDAVLRGWQTSRLEVRRAAYLALQRLCDGAYWASPEAWPLVGYPGPPRFAAAAPAAGGAP